MNYLNIKVGTGAGMVTQKMYLTTSESIVAVITDKCDGCDVPNKYDSSKSSHYSPSGRAGQQEELSEVFNENDRENLINVKYTGWDFVDYFEFQLPKYNRTTALAL